MLRKASDIRTIHPNGGDGKRSAIARLCFLKAESEVIAMLTKNRIPTKPSGRKQRKRALSL